MNELGRLYESCDCVEKNTTIKCNTCGIVYCGACQNTHIWVSSKRGKLRERCCPKCIGTSLQTINFDDSTAINKALNETVS